VVPLGISLFTSVIIITQIWSRLVHYKIGPAVMVPTVPGHCPITGVGSVGGPERWWAAWSGGLVPVAVTVLRHRGGCRGAVGGLLFLGRCRGWGARG
jgi:hypothetical protein